MSSTKRSINGKVVKAYQGVKLRSSIGIIDLIDAQTNNGINPMPVISEEVSNELLLQMPEVTSENVFDP